MGMKNSISLMSMMAIASAMSMDITERGSVGSSKEPKPPEPKRPVAFKDSEGVERTIRDYNLIMEGKSKKGTAKQERIKGKIHRWLEQGGITEDDLKQRKDKKHII